MTLPLELQVLVACGFLHFGLAQLGGLAKTSSAGWAWGVGNRDGYQPDFPSWVRRTDMAHRNLGESLPLFTILVLAVLLSGQSDRVSQLGAWVFLGARLAHAVLFILGVTGLRTLAFQASVLGMLAVGAALI